MQRQPQQIQVLVTMPLPGRRHLCQTICCRPYKRCLIHGTTGHMTHNKQTTMMRLRQIPPWKRFQWKSQSTYLKKKKRRRRIPSQFRNRASFENEEEKIGQNRPLSPTLVKNILKLGYKRAKANPFLVDDTVYDTGTLKFDPEFSNENCTVWRDTHDFNRPIVSFPGTNICNLNDLVADLYLAVGAEDSHPRFQEAKKHIELLRNESGTEPTLVSHSLGASINEYVGRFFPQVKQINVNKGAGFNTFNRPRAPNQTDINVIGDCISCLSCSNNCLPTGTSINIFPTWINVFRCFGPHRFDNLEQIHKAL